MKNLLLTGGCGFIGSHLARWVLQNRDWRITVLDRLDSAGSQANIADLFRDYPERISLVYHDLRAAVSDTTGIDLLTGGRKWDLERFDYVAHLAAASHVDRSVTAPIENVLDNVLGTANLLEFVRLQAALKDGGRVLYFGTDEQFGSAPAGVVFKPWARFNGLNPYAATKAGGDSLAVAWAHTYSIPIVITRCGNAFGPRQHAEKFIPIAIAKTIRGESVPVHAVGGVPCARLYLYVENVCSATVCTLESGTLLDGSDESGRYNITGSEERTNIEVIDRIANQLGTHARWHLIENPPGRLRPDLRYAISSEELLALGWKPTVSFDDGLRKTVESFTGKKSFPITDSADGRHPKAEPSGDLLQRQP